jgi:hypothetical protein
VIVNIYYSLSSGPGPYISFPKLLPRYYEFMYQVGRGIDVSLGQESEVPFFGPNRAL